MKTVPTTTFHIMLNSSGSIRTPQWLIGHAPVVSMREQEIIIQFRPTTDTERQDYIVGGAWLEDIFPPKTTNSWGRTPHGLRSMTIVFTKEDDFWTCRLPRNREWYNRYRSSKSKAYDQENGYDA